MLGNLVNIDGIVTYDKCVQAGIFILDNKIVVVMSMLCVITNIRKVQSGFKISIRNAHLMKLTNDKSAIILCAKSLLIIHEESTKSSIHFKSDKQSFETNNIIQDCLHLRLSPKQLLKVFENLTCLEQNIKEVKKCDLKHDILVTSYLKNILEFFKWEINNIPHRSLLNEFLSQPHSCSIGAQDGNE